MTTDEEDEGVTIEDMFSYIPLKKDGVIRIISTVLAGEGYLMLYTDGRWVNFTQPSAGLRLQDRIR